MQARHQHEVFDVMMQAGQARHTGQPWTSHRPALKPQGVRRCPSSSQGLHYVHKQSRRCTRHIVRAGDDQALATFARLSNRAYLDEAAKRFQEGLKKGQDEDYLIALELGADSIMSLSDLQLQYKDRVKAKLFQRIEELKAEEEVRINKLSKNFTLGKEAYSCGEYAAAAKLLEVAVEEIGTNSQLGGEAQLWLALAYQAMGRESDCIDLYKFIEANHPMPRIKRQAADLRYIIEAPKLEISEEERVKIPLITTDTWRTKERKSSFTSTRAAPPKPVKTSYWDKARWDVAPPSFIPDKWYVRVAWLALLVGVTLYANFQLTKG